MTSATATLDLSIIAKLGEGQRVEFKERVSKAITSEMVAFANAEGGTIYCGITDNGVVIGTATDNKILSQIHDLARNCEPSISVQTTITDKVVVITVPEGTEKPYQCAEGFFLRNGPNSQKLRGVEIRRLLAATPSFFDSALNAKAVVDDAVDSGNLDRYLKLSGVESSLLPVRERLANLQASSPPNEPTKQCLTNAGVLLFTSSPKQYIPEAIITAVRYAGTDRFSIIDRKNFEGSLVDQVDEALEFLLRHTSVSYTIDGTSRRVEHREYPTVALRELIINAVAHRDYTFQNSCIYIHLYADRLEIENPGGLLAGLKPDEVAGRSIRRNPLLADLLYRAGYGEKLGSGLMRVQSALVDNGNPPYAIVSTNFFSVRLLPRVAVPTTSSLTKRQLQILALLRAARRGLSSRELAEQVGVSITTITREVEGLLKTSLIVKDGVGRTTTYRAE